MATPHVSGAAALVWGTDPSMTYAQVKERLLMSRDYVGGMSRKIATSGRLNVYNAVMGIYPPSPEPAENQWQDYQLNETIETPHPYANNEKRSWTLEGPANAKFMCVVLSKVDLEEGYDFLKVVDGSGQEMDSVSGKSENTSTFYVSGNKMTLKFTSDSSETRWGFSVAKLQVVY